jgi:hypothetical protein
MFKVFTLSFSASTQMLYRTYYGNRSPTYYLFLYGAKKNKRKKKDYIIVDLVSTQIENLYRFLRKIKKKDIG